MSGMEPLYFPTLRRQDDATPPDPPPPPIPPKTDNPPPDDTLSAPEEVDQYLTRAHRRTYTPAERLGYTMLAVADGDSETCRRYGVPRATLQNWLREVGGLTQVREFLQARAVHDFLAAERSIYALVRRQADAGEIPKEELYQTVRSLIHARALEPVQAQPVAAAQANVTVTIGDKDGQRVIDLGPPPEETE